MIGIAQSLSALSRPLGPDGVAALRTYAEELLNWNRKINLTGAGTLESFIEGPLFDALTLRSVIEPEGSLVDVGSGGGLPGIPAAICCPEIRVTLVEPRAKRASFLRHAIQKLGLEIELRECRDESLPPNEFDAAVAQAVWPPKTWMERGVRLVRPGGAIYVLSSKPIAPTDLPRGVAMEQQRATRRPRDGKPRHAARVRTAQSEEDGTGEVRN